LLAAREDREVGETKPREVAARVKMDLLLIALLCWSGALTCFVLSVWNATES
jgi:hypothetical protein